MEENQQKQYTVSVEAEYDPNLLNDLAPDTRDYVGKNSEYYMGRFAKIKTTGNKVAWNWCAFLFTPAWFLYRKMFKMGIILMVAAFFLTNFIPLIGPLVNLGICIYYGRVGTNVYLGRTQTLALQGNQMNADEKAAFIKKKGGTSVLAIILSVVVFSVLLVLILYGIGSVL